MISVDEEAHRIRILKPLELGKDILVHSQCEKESRGNHKVCELKLPERAATVSE